MEASPFGPRLLLSTRYGNNSQLFQTAPCQWRSCRRDLAGSLRSVLALKDEPHARFGGVSFGEFPGRSQHAVRRCQDTNVLTSNAASSPDLTSELQDLLEFITSGVLSRKVGITPDRVAGGLDEWCELGNKLSGFLNFGELSEAQKVRIYQYYLPIFFWCQEQLSAHKSHFAAGDPIPPLLIGINAPQGCGKTTVVESLDFLFNSIGRPAAAMSVDDFYLTGADQDKLAADYPDNGLLKVRGNAGSHDLQFGTETINALLKLTTRGSKAKVPRYDKAARNGKGDRGDPSTWPVVEGPLEVLLFEGWMLGFEPQGNNAVAAVDPQLTVVNEFLQGYYDAWYKFINSWIIIQVGEPNWVFAWRLEAEIQMRKKGRGAMTDDQISSDFENKVSPTDLHGSSYNYCMEGYLTEDVSQARTKLCNPIGVADFVSRYMPAYKAYLPNLYSMGPRNATVDNTLKFDINKDRNPIG